MLMYHSISVCWSDKELTSWNLQLFMFAIFGLLNCDSSEHGVYCHGPRADTRVAHLLSLIVCWIRRKWKQKYCFTKRKRKVHLNIGVVTFSLWNCVNIGGVTFSLCDCVNIGGVTFSFSACAKFFFFFCFSLSVSLSLSPPPPTSGPCGHLFCPFRFIASVPGKAALVNSLA